MDILDLLLLLDFFLAIICDTVNILHTYQLNAFCDSIVSYLLEMLSIGRSRAKSYIGNSRITTSATRIKSLLFTEDF